MEDLKIIKEIKKGNIEVYSQIVVKYKKVVFNHSYSFLRSREDAEDAAQETFVNAYKNIKKFRGDSKFSTWLYRITVNVCKNKLKQIQRLRAPLVEEIYHGAEDDEDAGSMINKIKDNEDKNPEVILLNTELKDIIKKSVNELPTEQKTAIILRDVDGLDYNEMAKVLNLSVSAVKSKLFRAREQLRTKLKKYKIF
ncbi:MAG: sigma-70 family RNA polymerase sigma factor [bacterium]